MNVKEMSFTDLIDKRNYYRMEVARMQCGRISDYPLYYVYEKMLSEINIELTFRKAQEIPVEQEGTEGLPLFS